MTPVSHAEDRSRRRLLAAAGAFGLLGLAVGVTAVTGGLRHEPDAPLQAGPGRAIDLGLFRVVPLDARMTAIQQFGAPPKSAITVRARVTNLGDKSRAVAEFLNGVAAVPKPGLPANPDVLHSNGQISGDDTSEIHPRIPVDVRMVWSLPKNTTPRAITVVFRKWSYGQSFTTDVFEWTVGDGSPVIAQISIPVRQGPRP